MDVVTELQSCNIICCVVVVHLYVEGGVLSLCARILYYQLRRIVKFLVRKIAALATFETVPVLNKSLNFATITTCPLGTYRHIGWRGAD